MRPRRRCRNSRAGAGVSGAVTVAAAPQHERPERDLTLAPGLIGRSRAAVAIRAEAGGEWAVVVGDRTRPAIHAVLAGEVWIQLAPGRAHRLLAGDAIWVPAETDHVIGSQRDAFARPCDATSAHRSLRGGSQMRLGHSAPDTRIVTVRYTDDPDHVPSALLAVTAPLVLAASERPSLRATLQVLEAELADTQPETDAALDSILALLLVHVRRTAGQELCHDPVAAPAEGHPDPIARDARSLLHRHPEREWTTDALAEAVNVSRATLHRHFVAALGTGPLTYLTEWRMNLAAVRLRDSDDPVGLVARSVGYASPHAFSRAFHRLLGQTPREYRRAARSGASHP